jgi:3-methyladenine DNA glycosylase AlkD
MARAAMSAVAEEVERALCAAGSAERADHEKRYLKSALDHVGASVPAIRRAARAVRRARPDLARGDVLALVEALWRRPVHECRMAAVEVLDAYVDRLAAADVAVVERVLRGARTWALVDGLAAHVAGGLVERFPELGSALDRWATDEDFWIRRAALLALLVPLREGRGDFARFARYADAMLEEEEFFVRKAIGWVLRDASRKDPTRVAAWLAPRAARASGVTLREAVKYLAPRDRARILAAARSPAKKRLTRPAHPRRNAAPPT